MNNNSGSYWTAFYTKPRSEKKVSDNLTSKGYEVYCPTRTVIKQWSDRKKKVKEPLFRSYIFAKVNENDRQEILRYSGIVSSVFWLGKPAVIRQKEIDAIHNFLSDFPSAEPRNILPNEGDLAAINSGPLKGEYGEVIELRGKRAVLRIQSLGLEIQAVLGLSKLELTQ